MDIHCQNGAADDHNDWRTSSTFVRRRGGLPQDDATPATSSGAEITVLELLSPSLLAQALAGRPEAEALALKADLIRQAGYVSADRPLDPDEARREASARRLTTLLVDASAIEAELRRSR